MRLLCPPLKIIYALGKKEKTFNVLVRETGYAPQTVRKIVNGLIDEGYLEEESQGKYKVLRLTSKGLKVLLATELINAIERGANVEKIRLSVGDS